MTFTHQRWRSRRRLHLPIMQRNVIMSTITAHRTYGADRCCSVDAMREKRLQLISLGTPVSLQACCLLRSASAMQAPERIEDFFPGCFAFRYPVYNSMTCASFSRDELSSSCIAAVFRVGAVDPAHPDALNESWPLKTELPMSVMIGC